MRTELARIVIVAYSDGSIDVGAPLDQKTQCYGMLEVARDVVQAHKPEQIKIVPAAAMPKGK